MLSMTLLFKRSESMLTAAHPHSDPETWAVDRRVQNLLWQRPSLRSVTVESDGETVILQGKVASFYDKQLCISGSQRVPGVYRLIDRIEVVWPEDDR
jgi:hypothetical protein